MSLQPLVASLDQLTLGRYKSNLNSDAIKGANSLAVYSISQFAINQVLIIGEIGNEGTELILTHASTVPTGNTVTLVANLAKDHPKDTPVYIVPFDQLEFSRASTLSGSKSILGSLLTIDPEKDTMIYDEVVNNTGYYFVRFKNSLTGIFSDYSDGVPFAGLTENTVGYAINVALKECVADFSEKLTYEMMIDWTNQMLHLVRGKLKSWAEYQEFDFVVGTVSKTTASYSMPTTIYDKNSDKAVLNLRIENSYPLLWIDRSEYIQKTSEIASGDEIGTPKEYSIWDGNLYLWPYGNDETAGDDILMDFYTDIVSVDSDMDVIPGARFDMLIQYLKWKIKGVINNKGNDDMKDSSYLQFKEILYDAIRLSESGERNAFRPRGRTVNGVTR